VPKGAHAALAGKAIERHPERVGVDQVTLIGLVDGALDGDDVEFRGQIDERPDWRGNRDALAEPKISRGEARTTADEETWAFQFTAACHADVDPSG
jgi:hypothetical protein